ncbi:MAG: bestrophin family protein [Pseudomonadota bacterium]|nr:bestrophin family protein [Pseudomonadota bacterium]
MNRKSVLISALAFASTLICLKLGIVADFPLTLIATAIVFPLVFSISTAYNRREKALEEYGSIRAHGRSIYLAARDWVEKPQRPHRDQIRETLRQLLIACADLFTNPKAEALAHEARVYRCFSDLSEEIRKLRSDGMAPTEISRCNQYLSRMMTGFENIKNIYDYRTPRSLRAFSDFFILLLPVLYGPYFAFQALNFRSELFWVMPVLFSLILVGLANIQDQLENPFDQIGEDDVAIDPERFAHSLLVGESGQP